MFKCWWYLGMYLSNVIPILDVQIPQFLSVLVIIWWRFPEKGVPPVIIHFCGIVLYKPSSYGGTTIYGTPPYDDEESRGSLAFGPGCRSSWRIVTASKGPDAIGGFHGHGSTPIAGCFISWKILLLKWMRTGGTPISGKLYRYSIL